MELLMHLPKVVAVHVRVDLRRRDAGMAEHLLDRPEICPALEQMCREGMPERMGRDVLRDAGAIDVMLQDLPGAHPGQRSAARVEKENAFRLPFVETWA